jgi:hypothetical protein
MMGWPIYCKRMGVFYIMKDNIHKIKKGQDQDPVPSLFVLLLKYEVMIITINTQ